VKVESLILRNFRNIRETTLIPDPKLNILVGRNGQGKTSFLEALGLLAMLRSFRGSKTAEVIHWGEVTSDITCRLSANDENGNWQTDLKIDFALVDAPTQKANKIAFINGKPFKSSASYLTQRFGSFELGFHTVVFNPSDHDLVRGEPSIRRSFLDRVLAAEDIEYLKALQKYQRNLQQRNALLKLHEAPPVEYLQGFTEPLAELGAYLAYKRLEWLIRLNQRLTETLHKISPSMPDLRTVYLSNWVPETEGLSISSNNLGSRHFAGHGQLPSLELLEQQFWQKLSSLEAAEWKAGHSLVGPHRDDWTFYLGDQVLKGHGSQGEVRSALLALKLSELEMFRKATGHRPLFLLDDFSSELDRERRSFLLRFLSESDLQVFVTTTEDLPSTGKRFTIVDGKLNLNVGKPDQHDRQL
jgi:DNA replication and repair protein RecF